MRTFYCTYVLCCIVVPQDLYKDLIYTEVTPQVIAVTTATHQARSDDELSAAEKSINLPEGIINSLGQRLFPGMLLLVCSII